MIFNHSKKDFPKMTVENNKIRMLALSDENKGPGLQRITAFLKDEQDNIYVTGHFPGGNTGHSADNRLDFLTLKLNSSGELLWEHRYHRYVDSGEQPYGLVLQNDFVYVCGQSSSNGIGTHHDFVVVKIDANDGDGIGGYRYNNNGNEDCFYAIEVLDNDEVIVTGFSSTEFHSQPFNLITQKLSGVTGTLSTEDIKTNITTIFPNPISNDGRLHIENNQFIEYSIFTLTGSEIQQGNLKLENSSGIVLDNLSTGIYFIVLKNETEEFMKKLIVK